MMKFEFRKTKCELRMTKCEAALFNENLSAASMR